MCRVLRLHPSGYYAWKAQPESARAQDDRRLLGLLKHAWLASGGVYGYRKLTLDMRELGERCSKHRVAKLLKQEGLQAQRGYRRRPSRPSWSACRGRTQCAGAAVLGGNAQRGVGDGHHLHPHSRRLAVPVGGLDLFSRQVVGWSMGNRIDTQLALDALLMAVWRRRPSKTVLVHSDQGCQFTSHEWQDFLNSHSK